MHVQEVLKVDPSLKAIAVVRSMARRILPAVENRRIEAGLKSRPYRKQHARGMINTGAVIPTSTGPQGAVAGMCVIFFILPTRATIFFFFFSFSFPPTLTLKLYTAQ
jgi:hypothetical protein